MPELERQFEALMGDVVREIDISRRSRIFCNRNLRMETVEFIGFDMDYTLARYHQDKLEKLSIDITLEKLIANRGYPSAIRDLVYDPRLAIRGLVVDKKLGNVFKMDRHGYIGRVLHGKRVLPKEERIAHYRHARVALHRSRYVWIDTLFGLPDAVMYTTLVDFFDTVPERPDYATLFNDIRESIDQAHRDDSLKSTIKTNIADYIQADDKLAETLHKLRSSGKKLFLLTNSYYRYTDAVMTYLLHDKRAAYPSWRNYFDWIIVGGQKPSFFNDRPPFQAVDPNSGEAADTPATRLSRGAPYQGGNIIDFEQMTGAQGEKVLYIGDHIYGDILRLRKSHVWRTAMVVQELELEHTVSERLSEQINDLGLLDRRQRNLNSEIDYQALHLKSVQRLLDQASHVGRNDLIASLEQAKQNSRVMLDQLRSRMRMIVEEVHALEDSIEQAYNPYWGAVFREGNENSRFGQQVSDYADLYTSRVSNFLAYSPLRYFRAPRQKMPHEV